MFLKYFLPLSNLSYLLDELTFIDDITLKLKQEDTNKEHYELTLKHQYPPFKHQEEAILYGLNKKD